MTFLFAYTPGTHPLRSGWVSLFLVLCLLASGCVRTNPGGILPPGLQGTEFPEPLQPLASKLAQEGERNWVLNLNEMAVAAMRMGDRELAKRCLDESILNINAVFGTTPEAQRARMVFFSEDVKLFKGDPHERAMTFLYRGILYMQDGDWQNARASFRSGVLQDAFAEEEQFRADWAIFDYLISVCEVQMRRPFYANEAFERAAGIHREFPENYRNVTTARIPPAYRTLVRPEPGMNVLVITQTGTAPEKVRVGNFGQWLSVRRTVSGTPIATVAVGEEEPVAAPMVDSLYFQAATRGGRPFDRIQKRKVVFKSGSQIVGDVATHAGAWMLVTSDSSEQALVGLAVIGVGLVAYGLASMIMTQADIRQWTSIPDSLGVALLQAEPGPATISVLNPTGPPALFEGEIPPPGNGILILLSFPGPQPVLLGPG